MAIRTKDEYLAGLQDGRRVHYQGRAVPDVLEEPDLRRAAERSGIAFAIQHDQQYAGLAVDVDGGVSYSAMLRQPRSKTDLQDRARLIELSSSLGGCTIVLKEVGSDALFGLLRACQGQGLENAQRFFQRYRSDDLAIAVAQTDVKGDRALPPHQQRDPDLYLRVVKETADGIVVRGAKTHTSFAAHCDELVVLPTRAMTDKDADYAVSFAVPINTPGLNFYVSPYLAGEKNSFEHPLSSRYSIIESLTVFDDVFVPWDRVFLHRQPTLAGPLASAFVDYHRFTAISYKLPLMDLIVGAAFLVAKANGISKAGHVRDKLTQLVRWAETVRGLAQIAVVRSRTDQAGIQVPDPLAVNMAKYEFAHGYSSATSVLLDLAGGLLVTGPGQQDWDNPQYRAVLEKYHVGAVPGEERLGILNLIGDLVARDFGGYQSVLATHAEGSFEAEKMQLFRSYDPGPAVALAEAYRRTPGSLENG